MRLASRIVAAVLLTASTSRAEIPGARGYFGVGVFSVTPTKPPPAAGSELALSVELSFEWSRACLGFTALQSKPVDIGLETTLIGARAGVVLLEGSYSPYVAAGAAWLAQTYRSTIDVVGGAGYVYSGNGPALLGEVGLLLFREQRIGRATLVIETVLPLFEVRTEVRSSRWPLLLTGARLQL
jgi:hypothetical protein